MGRENHRRDRRLTVFSISPARRNRLILVAALVVIVGWMLYVARRALFPYILGLVIAYLVLPLVNFLDQRMPRFLRQRGLSRPAAILLVYLIVLGVIAGVIAFLVPVVVEQMQNLWADREDLARRGRELINEALIHYQASIPPEVRAAIEDSLSKAAGSIARAVQQGLVKTVVAVSSTVSFVLGMVVIPFWLFYILNDQAKVGQGVRNLIPDRLEADVVNIARIVDDILSAYIRGQLILCVAIGAMATVGLLIAGVRFAVLLGVVAGIFEAFPFVGPILGAIPGVIVAALQSPDKALWALVVFFAIQQIENLFLVPKVAGESVKLHPALVMVVLVVGNEALGIWGMLLAVPVTAIIRDVFKYLYLRTSEEGLSPQEALCRVRTETMRLDV